MKASWAWAIWWCVIASAFAEVPQNLDELWRDFPALEESTPLEAEVLQEWAEGDIVCRIVRYQVGVFKGTPARVAGFYAFPKGGTRLPALLGLHGGGQAANLDDVVLNARRGYASLSLNWGGNKLNFGRSKTTYAGPQTDWGRLDATHPPQRNKANHFAGALTPDEFTLDAEASPRNSNWYIVLMAARRGITFLEQQPEVDPARIGAYGHSMGGKLTTDLAGIEPRLKAAVPSCGGGGDILPSQIDLPGCVKKPVTPLELACVSDNAYIPRITCPVLWLSPTNDFNAPILNMAWNWRDLPDARTRFSISPHLNHRHTDAHAIAQYLWFEQHLRGKFALPESPRLAVKLDAPDGIPRVTVTPDGTLPVQRVDLYYSTDPHELTRFWRDAGAKQTERSWEALCPLMRLDEPLFCYADVHYALPESYRGLEQSAGHRPSDEFAISSRVYSVGPETLRLAGAKPTDAPERMIDDGTRGWQDWYRLNWDHAPLWKAATRKIKDPRWRGPDGASLVFEMNPAADNTLVVTATTNDWGAFAPGKPVVAYSAVKELRGGSDWQTVTVRLDELMVADGRLPDWREVTELSIGPSGEVVRNGIKEKVAGQPWKGPREIRNLRWEGGTYRNPDAPSQTMTPAEHQKAFDAAIKKSLDQEARDRLSK